VIDERRLDPEGGRGAIRTGASLLFFVAVTIVMTWPLGAGLSRDIPGDFGDPLFTSWVLSWDATHLGRGWWSANIFAPHPLTLAYSEHFLPQALQILPVYAVTGNAILCYNLSFLSTFALSGFGMFLLGRELTGSSAAGLVGGLAFAFAPYRIANIPHLHVLSAAWMPLVLLGLHRHYATRRTAPLVGAAVAWLMQNLSSGYYFLFFTPIVIVYIAWEITRHGLWGNARTLVRTGVAISIVLAATVPFLVPYVELRRLGFSARSLSETRRFSADVYAYFTADPNLRLWGPIAQAWPKSEGLLFPGLTIAVLAAIGLFRHEETAETAKNAELKLSPRSSRTLRFLLVVMVAVVITLLLGFSIRLPGIKITSLSRVLLVYVVASAAALAGSKSVRETTTRWLLSPAGVFSVVVLFSVAMSFGPDIRAKGRVVAGPNIYAFFFDVAPGFDGVRVPARYATIGTLGLAALAALGVGTIDRRRRGAVGVAAGTLILLEAIAVPIPINQNSTQYTQPGLAPLPGSVAMGSAAPEVYTFAATLPASAVLIELPLGEPAFDVRYMFYSTRHWRRLVNGYSGGAPQDYGTLTESLKDVATRPDHAWETVRQSTATHAIVHEASYANDGGRRLSDWLRSRGAREVAAFGSDKVFALPSPSRVQ
jgi:hypothetical protein